MREEVVPLWENTQPWESSGISTATQGLPIGKTREAMSGTKC